MLPIAGTGAITAVPERSPEDEALEVEFLVVFLAILVGMGSTEVSVASSLICVNGCDLCSQLTSITPPVGYNDAADILSTVFPFLRFVSFWLELGGIGMRYDSNIQPPRRVRANQIGSSLFRDVRRWSMSTSHWPRGFAAS